MEVDRIQFVISEVILAAGWGGGKEWRQGTLLEDCCSNSFEVNQGGIWHSDEQYLVHWVIGLFRSWGLLRGCGNTFKEPNFKVEMSTKNPPKHKPGRR